MLARVFTNTIFGIEALPVDVEVKVRSGTPRFVIIGLGDGAIRESRERVLAALTHSGFYVPEQILVNLAPAELKKEGSAFDLAIALGILVASGQVSQSALEGKRFYGELALDGGIKPVRGIVAFVLGALAQGCKEVVVALENEREAQLVKGVKVTAVNSFCQLMGYLRGEALPNKSPSRSDSLPNKEQRLVSDVLGQNSAKRAMVIAAAGGHNLLMIGPPGCGKSMLAERFPALLPPLLQAERMEVAKIYSIVGMPLDSILSGIPPYRNPHHIISDAGLVGGGTVPRPGEITLAHHGVLFLDEFPEFRRSALESLRAPLETGRVRISRARGSTLFPARFQLLAAMNTCPCGRLGVKNLSCSCSRQAVAAYLKKLSQPILDRIDLHVELEAVSLNKITNGRMSGMEQDSLWRDTIAAAHRTQLRRQASLNSTLENRQLNTALPIDEHAGRLLESAGAKAGLSARGFMRTMRVAHTICDLAGENRVKEQHVAEALSFRAFDKLKTYLSSS